MNPTAAKHRGLVRPCLMVVASCGALLEVPRQAHAQCALSFNPAADYAVSHEPFSVAVGEFNGDGRLDLAVGIGTVGPYSLVGILRGNSDGTFQPAVNFPAGPRNTTPAFLAVGDFNLDGHADLVVANGSATTISVLPGNGDGTFQAPWYWTVGTDPRSLVVGDFNVDGQADVAVANWGGGISVLIGNGDLTFRPLANYPDGGTPSSIATGDVNNDGRPDLVVANLLGDDVSVFLGAPGGTFQPATDYPAGPVSCAPRAVAIGQFDGEGGLDVAVANRGNAVSILPGSGNGIFSAPISYALPAGDGPEDLTVADFDGDGRPDLAVALSFLFGNHTVAVLAASADGTLHPPVMFPVAPDPYSIASGDFNADGRPDLVTANINGMNVSVLLNSGHNAVVDSPDDLEIGVGQRAVLSVVAGGSGPHTYRWRHNGVSLTDGARVGGATAPTLTIDPAMLADGGVYDVIVTNGCGPATSDGATLTVVCSADWDRDGVVGTVDYFSFMQAFMAGEADFNGNQVTDSQDVYDYLRAFFAGCH